MRLCDYNCSFYEMAIYTQMVILCYQMHCLYNVAALALLVLGLASAFDNEFDERLRRECPRGQGISKIHSVHSNRKEDRRFDIECRPASHPSTTICQWSEYLLYIDILIYDKCIKSSSSSE